MRVGRTIFGIALFAIATVSIETLGVPTREGPENEYKVEDISFATKRDGSTVARELVLASQGKTWNFPDRKSVAATKIPNWTLLKAEKGNWVRCKETWSVARISGFKFQRHLKCSDSLHTSRAALPPGFFT
jgi:hypothetical protein